MKKIVFYFLSFIFAFFISSSTIEAKSVSYDGIEISFGEESEYNFYYVDNYNFELEDHTFYYDGKEYVFNEDYTLINSSIEVKNGKFTINNETLSLDRVNMLIIGETIKYHYAFPVFVTVTNPSTSYEFSQVLCYKYNSKQECNQDTGDTSVISESSTSVFYYSFLPFYNEDIKFDYIEYKFTLKSENETINLDPIRFNKEEIIYKEYFKLSGYQNVSEYNNLTYIRPQSSYLKNGEINVNISFTPSYRYRADEIRYYQVRFYSCVGENYSDCSLIYYENNDHFKVPYNVSYYYPLTIPNLTYDISLMKANYDSFLLKGSYVCVENCGTDPMVQTNLTFSNEQIFHFSFMAPKFVGTIDGKAGTCYISGFPTTCYASNKKVTNKLEFEDDNGIEEVYYVWSENRITNIDEITTLISNGAFIDYDPQKEGYHYFYYKVIDGSGQVSHNLSSPYIYLFDKSGPNNPVTNFDTYDTNKVYNNLELTISYTDNYMGEASKIYYLVVNGDDNVTIDQIKQGNLYSNKVSIKENISHDGDYKVCFIGEDLLGNYSSDITCSQIYHLDITSLSIDEVVVSKGDSSYQDIVNIQIDVLPLQEEISFLCGLVAKNNIITSYNDLKSTCYNKQDNYLTIKGEGEYSLWIYAPDNANNYSLLKFEEIYLIDTLAPRVTYTIVGDNSIYSNDVYLDVEIEDINTLNEESLSYEFYLSTYNEAQFIKFDDEKGIEYPFNYYGSYKLAIKACDILNNCKINLYTDIFAIDTSVIEINLVGEEEIHLLKWSKYKELGAKASKGNGGKTPVSVEYNIESNVNTNKAGVYYVTYTSGEGMNKVSITRKVVVEDNVTYLVSLGLFIIVGEAIILLRLFYKKRKNDSI